jgi:ferredoxin--NADP+ reductase
MVCGNPEMVKELRVTLGAKGYQTSRRSVPGQIAFEKYW